MGEMVNEEGRMKRGRREDGMRKYLGKNRGRRTTGRSEGEGFRARKTTRTRTTTMGGRMLFVRCGYGDYQGAVVGGEAPVGGGEDVAFGWVPFAGHAGAEEDVVDAGVGVLGTVEVGPGDVARVVAGFFRREVVAVAFGGASVGEFGFAATDEVLDGAGILGVVEVAEDDEVGVGVGFQPFIDSAAQEAGFFLAHVGFAGDTDGAFGFQMGGEEGEGVGVADLDVHLRDAAAHLEAATIHEVAGVRVRAFGREGIFAEDGDEDVRVKAAHMFPVGIVEALGFQGGAQFQEGGGEAHLLEGEDVGVQGFDGGADLGFGFGGFEFAAAGGVVDVVLDVVGGDAEVGRMRRKYKGEKQSDKGGAE